MLMRQIQLVKGIFMNNILVINNTIEEYENEFVVINNNNITFKKNCDYSIYYENCTNINININILDNVYVKLFEYMSDLEINETVLDMLLEKEVVTVDSAQKLVDMNKIYIENTSILDKYR